MSLLVVLAARGCATESEMRVNLKLAERAAEFYDSTEKVCTSVPP